MERCSKIWWSFIIACTVYIKYLRRKYRQPAKIDKDEIYSHEDFGEYIYIYDNYDFVFEDYLKITEINKNTNKLQKLIESISDDGFIRQRFCKYCHVAILSIPHAKKLLRTLKTVIKTREYAETDHRAEWFGGE